MVVGAIPQDGFFLYEVSMERIEKEVLQVSKEIAVKFIETQRISPTNFAEIFPNVYKVVLETVAAGQQTLEKEMQRRG